MNSRNPQKKYYDLIKGVGIYGVGTFGTKILSFLIVPIYTYYISTSDMGTYDVLISTISLLIPIITMQISDAAYRWIIQSENSHVDVYIRATIQVLVVNCIIAIAIIIFINKIYTIQYCMYFCILLVLSIIYEVVQKILRGLHKQFVFALSGIMYAVVFFVLNIIQLCVMKWGIISLFYSSIISYILCLILICVLIPQFRINFTKKTNVKLVLEMYRYSAPLVPNYLNWWVINSSDRYITLYFLGNSANGILAIAHKFPSMLQSVLSIFNNSWQDLSVSDNDQNIGKDYTRIFQVYSRIALTMLLPLIPFTKIVVMLIMSNAYKTACDYIAFYYIGSVFQSFSSFYGVGYLRNKKTKNAFFTSILGAIVNAIVNIALIRIMGIQAASVSTFAGFLVMWLIREKQNRRELKISIIWTHIILYTTLTILMSICSICTDLSFNIILFCIGLIIFGLINYSLIKAALRIVVSRTSKK